MAVWADSLCAEGIRSAKEAIARADALTGLNAISGPAAAVSVKVTQDVTPFLGARNEGKAAWRVEYPESVLRLSGASPGLADQYRRAFSVMLDAFSGHLLFVSSSYLGPRDPALRAMPSSHAAGEQLRSEEEVYEGYPEEAPKVTFLGALQRILDQGVSNPLAAKEIHGAYVLEARMGAQPRAVWAITLRGLPPLPAHGPGGKAVPVWQRNHVRNVVDATTGQVLFATNSPQ
jgi:hypothetical protein